MGRVIVRRGSLGGQYRHVENEGPGMRLERIEQRQIAGILVILMAGLVRHREIAFSVRSSAAFWSTGPI